MNTLQPSNTSIPEAKDNLNTWTGGYTQVPNTILKASNLDSDSKVALALLYSTFTFAKDNNELAYDNSFYFTNARWSEQMDISGDQVIRKVIPDLVDRGLIRTVKRLSDGKTKNYYILDFNAINNYDGSTQNQLVEQKKTARAQKAYSGRIVKEAKIMWEYGGKVLELILAPLTIEDREALFLKIATELSQEKNYKLQTAKTIINKMLSQYSAAQQNPQNKPEWLKWHESLANTDEIPY